MVLVVSVTKLDRVALKGQTLGQQQETHSMEDHEVRYDAIRSFEQAYVGIPATADYAELEGLQELNLSQTRDRPAELLC